MLLKTKILALLTLNVCKRLNPIQRSVFRFTRAFLAMNSPGALTPMVMQFSCEMRQNSVLTRITDIVRKTPRKTAFKLKFKL